MENLNDDIFFEILKLLSYRDQLNLLNAIPAREQTMKEYWQWQFRGKLRIDFLKEHLSEDQFRLLLKTIHKTLKSVKLEYCSYHDVIFAFKFPKVEEVDLLYCVCCQNDDNLLKLASTFPALRKFKPYGDLSGKYMGCLWPELEELDLRFCKILRGEYLHEILTKLKLRVLKLNFVPDQEIFKNQSYFNGRYLEKLAMKIIDKPFIDFGLMPQLQELSLTGPYSSVWDNILTSILLPVEKQKASRDYDEWNKFNKQWDSLLFLREFVMLKSLVAENFGCLRTITFNGVFFECETFVEILYASKNLQLLSFEMCTMNFPEIVIDVQRLIAQRETTLTLNIFESLWCKVVIEDEDDLDVLTIKQIGVDSELLRITSEPLSNQELIYYVKLKVNKNKQN